MGSLFRLTGDTVTPSAGTRVLKASEAAVLLEANAVLDAARERVADMERKAGEAYERRREEGYRDGVEEGRLEHAEKVMETVLSSVEYIEGIEATLVNVVAVAVRKVIGEIDENERIVRIVRNALVTVRNQQHVTIRVAPADEKAVREGLASMLASVTGGASFLDVVPDARLERGRAFWKASSAWSMPASRHSSRRWKTPCVPKSLHSAYRLRGQRRQPLAVCPICDRGSIHWYTRFPRYRAVCAVARHGLRKDVLGPRPHFRPLRRGDWANACLDLADMV
ncbi:MAG: HrpE/YscL family type III secretion apparatus protein [Bilophila wadsworthia]